MNERLKELALKAYNNAGQGTPEALSSFMEVYSEKFAELIVRECAGKCEFVANMATITNDGETARKTKATAESCATMIKEHFGVKNDR